MGESVEKHMTVGICVARIQDPYLSEMVQAICELAKTKGISTLIYSSFVKMDILNSFAIGEYSIFDTIPFNELSALVVFTDSLQNDDMAEGIIKKAAIKKVPVISINQHVNGCFNIMFDFKTSFERIVRHVIEEHKCRTINFLAGFQGNPFSEERIEVYKRVLEDNQIPFDEERFAYGQFWEEPAIEICEGWIASGQSMPEAIICANDIMAIAVCLVLEKHGIRVPEDVIVTGFDGIDMERYCSPRLTTAQLDSQEIATKTIEVIETCSLHAEAEKYDVLIPLYVRFRESCGCQPLSKCNPNEQVLKLYGKSTKIQAHVSSVFQMMNALTDGHSATAMFQELQQYMPLLQCDYMICVNRLFYQETDIVLPHRMKKDSLLLLMKRIHGEDVISYREVVQGKRFDLIQEFFGKEPHAFLVPLHWQEEVYGVLIVSYHPEILDYERFYEFVLGLEQSLATIRKQSQLHNMFIRDPLTSLYNRRGFYLELQARMNIGNKKGITLFLAAVDLDHLKRINDLYGHGEGDFAIKKMAQVLEKVSDKQSICARFGGDEYFVATILEEPDESYPLKYRARFYKEIEKTNQRIAKPYLLAASCGMVCEPVYGMHDIEMFMKKADNAMYECKLLHHANREERYSK